MTVRNIQSENNKFRKYFTATLLQTLNKFRTFYFITMFSNKEGSEQIFTLERVLNKTLSWAREVLQITESGTCNAFY